MGEGRKKDSRRTGEEWERTNGLEKGRIRTGKGRENDRKRTEEGQDKDGKRTEVGGRKDGRNKKGTE